MHGNCSALPRETRGSESVSVKRTRGKTRRQGRLAPSLAPISSANEARSRSRTKGNRPANTPRGKANDAQGRLADCGLGARKEKPRAIERAEARTALLAEHAGCRCNPLFLVPEDKAAACMPILSDDASASLSLVRVPRAVGEEFPLFRLGRVRLGSAGRALHRSAKLNIRPSLVRKTVGKQLQPSRATTGKKY